MALRDHPWIWKAPVLLATMAIWLGALVMFVAPWQGSNPNDARIRTGSTVAEPVDSISEQPDESRAGVIDAGEEDAEPTEPTEPEPEQQPSTVIQIIELDDSPDAAGNDQPAAEPPVPTEADDDTTEPPPRRASSPTPAPPAPVAPGKKFSICGIF